MMKKNALTPLMTVALVSISLIVAGCGGGGGGGGSSSSTPSTPVVTTPTITVALTDAASGASTNSLSLGNPAKASATVLDGNKAPVANTVVTFATNPEGLVTLTPVVATALTDSKGVASIQLAPASLSSAGAGTLSAKASVNATEVSGSIGFNVGSASIGLSGIAAGQNPLGPYGTTSITVNVTGVPSNYPVSVAFSSICGTSGKAKLTANVQSINGVATANYTDVGCASTDNITASVAGTTVTASTTLTVQAPGVASIQFVSATPETIVLKGTGGAGYQETSLVKFKVVDNNNQAVANTSVQFDLSTRAGGILLEGSASKVTKITDAIGEVQVSVQSGSIPTSVLVTAEVSAGGQTFTTQSNKLAISTGRPAQDRFSLSIETLNIEGWSRDGETSSVTVIASDRLGNPVPDGVTINFVNSGGQIEPSCATTQGSCSVKFTSANPRPLLLSPDTEPSQLAVTAGRVAILAYTTGEESFSDINNNNLYDSGEPYNDLGQAFIDRNENRVFDATTPSEESIVFATTNTSTCAANQIATSPATVSRASTCDSKWGAAHVRQSNVIVMSGSDAFINETLPIPGFTSNTTYNMNNNCAITVSFYVYDVNRNPMPAKTTITTTALPDKVTADVVNGTVNNTNAPGGTLHSITVKKEIKDGACPLPSSTFSVPVVITTPNGTGTIRTLTLNP